MNKRNYQKELEKTLESVTPGEKTLLLHSCCAPCSSYCMEYLRDYFKITVFYYNPNITEDAEYRKRVEEEKRLIQTFNNQVSEENKKIEIIEGDYEPDKFLEVAKGFESCQEGGERCTRCFKLRLSKSVQIARKLGFDYATTTLTISPLKDADRLNEIGEMYGELYGISWLPTDFKKKNGYKRSIELSKEFDLYRQDYCGCCFSKAARLLEKDSPFIDN